MPFKARTNSSGNPVRPAFFAGATTFPAAAWLRCELSVSWTEKSHRVAWVFPATGAAAWRVQLAVVRMRPIEMGDPGFEPGTSSLSETRSNQLS